MPVCEAFGSAGGLVRLWGRLSATLTLLGCLLIQPLIAQEVPRSREQIALSFAPVVRETSSAVVNIYTRKTTQTSDLDPFFSDPFFSVLL